VTWKVLRLHVVAALVIAYSALAIAVVSGNVGVAGTPPPSYTGDPATAITNALGGVGRTQGWTVIAPAAAAVDVLASANIPAAIQADVEAPSSTYTTRFVTVKRVLDNASEANLAVCVRLGPDTDSPALACADTDEVGQAGGCFLTATNDSCTVTIRPIQQCTSYATCHQPVWVMASGGDVETTVVAVSVVW
jgi:hypothetical protein